jgi:hypothetical protein
VLSILPLKRVAKRLSGAVAFSPALMRIVGGFERAPSLIANSMPIGVPSNGLGRLRKNA